MTDDRPLRALFNIGVTPAFFDAGDAERKLVFDAIVEAFTDLGGRFGITVLGTFDDDLVMVGASTTAPWTSTILADIPDLESVGAVCNLLRTTSVGELRLWKYLKIEARVGRALFFGNA